MPAVSIIIPNYNHAPFLAQRLDSVFQQTFQDFEVILLDDASTDNSLEILSAYAAKYADKVAHFIINEKNSGSPFRQWKKGIELTKGEYIWIAESDDWAKPELLKELVGILEKNPEVGLAYCQSLEADKASKVVRDFHFWTDDLDANLWRSDFVLPGNTFFKYLVEKNVIPNASAVLFRKKLYNEAGKVQSDFKLLGDWDLWVRLLSKASIGYSALHLNHFRSAPNTTRDIASKEKKELRFLEELRVLGTLNNLNVLEKEVSTRRQYLINKWKNLYLSNLKPTLFLKNFSFLKLNLLRIYCWQRILKVF